MAGSLTTLSARDMIEALIAGERNPQALAGLARARMKAKYAALAEALAGGSVFRLRPAPESSRAPIRRSGRLPRLGADHVA